MPARAAHLPCPRRCICFHRKDTAIHILQYQSTAHWDALPGASVFCSKLVCNASKFTQQGAISPTVARQPTHDEGWVTFHVSDTGIGMKPEQIAQLFQ